MPSTRNLAAIRVAAALKPAENSAEQTALFVSQCLTAVLENGSFAQIPPHEVTAIYQAVGAASQAALDCHRKLFEAHTKLVDLAGKYVERSGDNFGPDCLPKGAAQPLHAVA